MQWIEFEFAGFELGDRTQQNVCCLIVGSINNLSTIVLSLLIELKVKQQTFNPRIGFDWMRTPALYQDFLF